LDALATAHPTLVKTFVLGNTGQGRPIRGVHIAAGKGATREFVFHGGIHAREWITPATVLYITNELVTKYGNDADVTRIVDGLNFAIIPVLNPDGYTYTFSTDRMWRKNRQANSGSSCIGVDLNRNFPYQFNTGGSSPDPCSETYHGGTSNSTAEVRALTAYLGANRAILAGFIDFHSYSQLLMYAWGYSTTPPPDNTQLKAVGDASARALQNVYGTRYTVGPIATTIYIASGSSVDFAYGALNVKFSYTYELRDTGASGFLLPPAQIIPSGIETFESFKVLILDGPLGPGK